VKERGRKVGKGKKGTNGDELSSNLSSLSRVVDVALVPGLGSNSLDLSSVLVEGSSLDHPGEEGKGRVRVSFASRSKSAETRSKGLKRLTSFSPGPWVQVPIVEGTCHAPTKKQGKEETK